MQVPVLAVATRDEVVRNEWAESCGRRAGAWVACMKQHERRISLKSTCSSRAVDQMYIEVCTHSVFRFVSKPIARGIVPLNLLPAKSNTVSFVSKPISFGIGPVSALWPNCM